MSLGDVTVSDLVVARESADGCPEILEALRETSGRPGATLAQLWPLAIERVGVTIGGVPTAYPNAIRRVVLDEMEGWALTVRRFDESATTEPYMISEFVNTRINLVPLTPQIPDDVGRSLRLELNVANATETDMPVYTGDLRVVGSRADLETIAAGGPLFNPLTELARLAPGKTMVIPEIRLERGRGGAFAVAHRAVCRPLDLEELPRANTHARRLAPEEIERLPEAKRAEARAAGSAAAQSGYVVSSAVADPRVHRVEFSVSAVPAGSKASRAVFVDACANVIDRLSGLEEFLGEWATRPAGGEPTIRRPKLTFSVGEDAGASAGARNMVGTLDVADETETIGELVVRTASELRQTVANASYTCVVHSKKLSIRISHAADDVDQIHEIFVESIAHARKIFEEIRDKVRVQ